MNYIRGHWRGEQALLWSLFVNLIFLRALLVYCDKFTLPPYVEERSNAVVITMIYAFICHGVVYIWQAVGLFRASERKTENIDSRVWVWVTYAALIASFVFTLLSLLGFYQGLDRKKFEVKDPLALENARKARYSLELSTGGSRISLSGTFELGMTAQLKDILRQNPDIQGVTLRSEGGNVYEGRGVAHLLKKHRLSTYVFDVCKSACVTAFIGGTKRYIGRNARLGFHRYGLDLRFPIPLYDLEEEEGKDISFYREQNIDEEFIQKAFHTPHKEIWFPRSEQLLKAGVVHVIMDQ